MPPDNRGTASSSAAASGSKKRSTAPKRNAIACLRCKERKARCVPAPPGSSPVPTCTNCLGAKKECIYLDRTPNEIFLLEYVSQLESRCAALETELRKHHPGSRFASDHIQAPEQAREAAVDKLNSVYPPVSAAVQKDSGHPDGGSGSLAADKTSQQTNAETPRPGNPGMSGAPPSEDGDEQDDGDEDDFALGIGMLSLGGGEEPVYVGPSSGVNWARVCATALRRPRDRSQPSHLSRFSYLAPPELASVQSALEYTLHHPTPPLPPPALAAHYLDLVYEYVQSRYGCFDWNSVRFWHENREAICQGRPLWGVGTGQDERRSLGAFFLWLCYGYGARLSEGEKLPGAMSHEVYYNAAVACLSTLSSHHSLATVQALILLTIYGFRHPTAEVSVWQVGGLSMRTAVELGLHRRTTSKEEREQDPRRYEMKKRVFWAVYSLDRMMSAQLGRPSGIQDRDIDVELPLNVNVDFDDTKTLASMQNQQSEMMGGRRPGDEYSMGYGSVTSMTSAIHNIRLNQLKQMITDVIYRLDKPLKPSKDVGSPERQAIPEVDILLGRLDQWRACHPDPPPGVRVPMLSREHWELEYHNCVQMLVRPIIASRRAGRRYVGLCLESAVALCETQFTYLQPPVNPSKLSTWRFYRIFLAGMTILHIITTFPIDLSNTESHRAETAIRQCEASLSIWGEKFRGAKRHEKLFKEMIGAWEARRHAGMASNQANQSTSSSTQHRPRPLQPPAPSNSSQAAADFQPPADIMAQFLNLVHFAQMAPARPAQLFGQEPPALAQALYGAETSCNGPDEVTDSDSVERARRAVKMAVQGARGGTMTGGGNMVQDHFGRWGPSMSGGGAADVQGADWTTPSVYTGGTPSQAEAMELGIKDDFFSLISSFGIDTDSQTPLLGVDGHDPSFDFSASHLPSAPYGQNLSASQNDIDVGNSQLNWGDQGAMDMSEMGMGSNKVGDPNMGMSDWALFDSFTATTTGDNTEGGVDVANSSEGGGKRRPDRNWEYPGGYPS